MKKMKLTVASLAVAIGFIASSCGSDDGPSASIVGKWDYVKTVTKQGNQPEQSIEYAGDEPGCSEDYQEFVEGAAFRDVAFYQNQDDVCQEFVEDGTWQQNGNELTIAREGENPETFTIVLLNNSSLRYKQVTEAAGVTFTATVYLRRIN